LQSSWKETSSTLS
jgi:hypothetical protein